MRRRHQCRSRQRPRSRRGHLCQDRLGGLVGGHERTVLRLAYQKVQVDPLACPVGDGREMAAPPARLGHDAFGAGHVERHRFARMPPSVLPGFFEHDPILRTCHRPGLEWNVDSALHELVMDGLPDIGIGPALDRLGVVPGDVTFVEAFECPGRVSGQPGPCRRPLQGAVIIAQYLQGM